jgi:hypothetical protein
MNRNRIFILLGALALTTLSGCFQNAQLRGAVIIPAETHSNTTTIITRRGPPPHSPTHGHRHRHQNHDLQFDSDFGAYLVIGSPGLYFYNDYYMRFYGGVWQITARLDRPWHSAQRHQVPHNLREHHAKQRHAKEHREERRHERHEKKHQRRDDRHEAPRHGHRRHQHGHELTYDTGISAYRIRKRPGIYFYNDRYIRQHRGVWQTTKKLNGKWRRAKEHHVPAALMKSKHRKKNKKDKHERHESYNDRPNKHRNQLQDVWRGN